MEIASNYGSNGITDDDADIGQAVLVDDGYWLNLAFNEGIKAKETRRLRGNGIDTVFLIDTSKSMAEEGFKAAKEVFQAAVQEIESSPYPDPAENIAVVIFGGETRIVQHLTCNYSKLKRCLDDVVCKGSSPLQAGLIMCLGIFKCAGSKTVVFRPSGLRLPPRIILITDGHVTDSHYLRGPEGPIYYDQEEEILRTLTSEIEGEMIEEINASKQIGRSYANATIASLFMIGSAKRDWSKVSPQEVMLLAPVRRTEEDGEVIKRILVKGKIGDKVSDIDTVHDVNMNLEIPGMPPLGSRVRRGRDWKWGNQDKGTVGTVVNHDKTGWLWVEWDTGVARGYRWGAENAIDVVVVDEPRILRGDEHVQVGCHVIRGPDWEWGDQDGGACSLGVIYRVIANEVFVRWSNGHKSNYRFGHKGKFDVKITDPGYLDKGNVSTKKNSSEFTYQNATANGNQIRDNTQTKDTKVVRWQWKDRTKKWNVYPEKENSLIESVYKKNTTSTVVIDLNGEKFRIVLKRKKHINLITKEESEIRREPWL